MLSGPKKSVQAKLVGTTLVAAFRASNPSLIWKFDLERNHSFTLALQGEDGDFELGVTSAKGEFYAVARFASREDAEEAFVAVQRVLMKRKWGWVKCLLIGIVSVLCVALLIVLFDRYFSGHTLSVIPASGTPGSLPQGVPLPADQVLKPPS